MTTSCRVDHGDGHRVGSDSRDLMVPGLEKRCLVSHQAIPFVVSGVGFPAVTPATV
jgi:hypothetical protein